MLEYLALASVLAACAVVAAVLLRRGHGPSAEALRAEQARVLDRLDQVARQGADVAAASQAQRADVATLLEAARAQQSTVAALGASVAEQRQQVAGLQAAMDAAAKGLVEVKQASEAQRLALGTSGTALAHSLAEAKQMLTKVQAEAAERAQREAAAHASLARLEQIIAGTKSRGDAGENLLGEVIRQLPAEFRAYDVRIAGKTVEFAIPLPDGRYLPVDSKWTSVDKLEALASCPEEERAGLVAALQKDVERKVDEVAKYLDPEKTCMMAVLAVPDAVYDLCAEAHVEAHRRGVVIVAYGLAVPYVLSVLQVIRRFGARVDEAQLSHMVRGVLGALDEMSEELEGRFAKGLTQLENSRRALRGSLGKAQQAVGRVEVAIDAGTDGHGQGNGDGRAQAALPAA